MTEESVYYSENSMENTVFVENEVEWNSDCPEITVDYAEASMCDRTLAVAYQTADENASHYFSIVEPDLEAQDADIQQAVKAGQIIMEQQPEGEEAPEDNVEYEDFNKDETEEQVVLYRLDESDDLYALQVADDGNGNLQKYRYKVRQTEDGQFEAVPGTIELQPSDLEDDAAEQEQPLQEDENEAAAATVEEIAVEHLHDIKVEQLQHHQVVDIPDYYVEPDSTDEHISHMQLQEEAEIMPAKGISKHFLEEYTELDDDNVAHVEYLEAVENEAEIEYLEEGLHEEAEHQQVQQQEEPKTDAQGILEQYIEQNVDEVYQEQQQQQQQQLEELHEPPTEAEVEAAESFTSDLIALECLPQSTPKCRILNKSPMNGRVSIFCRDGKKVQYLLLNALEKENIAALPPQTKSFWSNPRSILKSNQYIKDNENRSKKRPPGKSAYKSQSTQSPPGVKVATEPATKPVDVIPAKTLRAPRKQRITPIDRAGSEILVMPFSFSVPIVEDTQLLPPPPPATAAAPKRKPDADEVLQISDDTDADERDHSGRKPKKGKKVKKPKKPVEILISDSDDASDGESVQLVNEEEEGPTNGVAEEPKTNDVEAKDKDGETQVKDKEKGKDKDKDKEKGKEKDKDKEKGKENEKSEEDASKKAKSVVKNNIKCPKCPKTFPKQISLRIHMHVHSERETKQKQPESNAPFAAAAATTAPASRATRTSTKTSKAKSEDDRLCEECDLVFKTQLMLARHRAAAHSQLEVLHCDTCPKTFSSKDLLAAHQRFHGKQNPKVEFKRPLPVKTAKETSGLRSSSRISRPSVLMAHQCQSCTRSFSSKLLLDEHVRKNCIATSKKSPNAKPSVNKAASASVAVTASTSAAAAQAKAQPKMSVANSRRSSRRLSLDRTVVGRRSQAMKRLSIAKKSKNRGIPLVRKLYKPALGIAQCTPKKV